MKKYIIYIGISIVSFLLGFFISKNSTKRENTHYHSKIEEVNQTWTCSMHPQIIKSEPGHCPICGMDLIPLNTDTEVFEINQLKLTKNAMALANIQTSIVVEKKLKNNEILISGEISENKDRIFTQPAHFDGRIERLHINSVGEYVEKGQIIAEIYSPEIIEAQQELISFYNVKELQPRLYAAVRNKFKNWKISGKQLSEIEVSGKVKTNFAIHSHVSGVVSEILVNEGAHIMDGHPIFKVVDLNTVWANFEVYENQISQFKIGQKINITTNVYANKIINAKVSFIDPILNTKTRTLKLRAVLDNKKGIFKPGMFVKGVVEKKDKTSQKTIEIPETAILWTGKRSVVYIKTDPKENIFEMREISLGIKTENKYEVIQGLDAGDEVVTNGAFTVDAAAQLQGKKSMMNK